MYSSSNIPFLGFAKCYSFVSIIPIKREGIKPGTEWNGINWGAPSILSMSILTKFNWK